MLVYPSGLSYAGLFFFMQCRWKIQNHGRPISIKRFFEGVDFAFRSAKIGEGGHSSPLPHDSAGTFMFSSVKKDLFSLDG